MHNPMTEAHHILIFEDALRTIVLVLGVVM